MDSTKAIARPGYMLAALLFVLPVVDTLMSVWPVRLGEERWRYGAFGSLSNLTLLPLIGLFLALAIAIFADHPRVRRALGWTYAVFAGVLMLVACVFVLDFFQTRAMVRPNFQHAMTIATSASLLKQVCTIVVLIFLALVGLRGPKAAKKTATPRETPPLIRR